VITLDKHHIILYGCLLAALFFGAVMALNWYHGQKAPSTQQWTEPQQIKTAEKATVIYVNLPAQGQAYDKKDLARMDLPKEIINNPDKQVLKGDTAVVPAYKGETEVVSVIDTKQGTSEMIMKQRPLSLFGLPNEKFIGLKAGITESGYAAGPHGKWDALRIGSFQLAVQGEILVVTKPPVPDRVPARWFGGFSVDYHF
jgi:hypothetical protein